jgi:hypothetical protein
MVRVWGEVGKLGCSREGVGEEWGREDESTRERGASSSVAARQRGKGGKKVGVPGVGVPRGAGVPWGLAPTGGRRPAVARAQRSRVTCAARVSAGQSGERED